MSEKEHEKRVNEMCHALVSFKIQGFKVPVPTICKNLI